MSHTNAIGHSQVLQSLLGQSDRVQSTKKDAIQPQLSATEATTTQFSTAASALSQVSSATTSDVRTDKVAAIQQAIAAGTYSVPASAVADKLIQHLLG